ncbi:MAG: DAK2 domain-containing protein [Clostridia bacterium]|nr:DAK2 domain-containing protein [Clostridia bacterium]
MNKARLDANSLYGMLVNGYRNLCLMETKVNDLNVFPVPDGDTGTNMVKTLGGGILKSVEDFETVSSMMSEFSRNVLLSARGNSGVILSQFIRGWANALRTKDDIDVSDIKDMMRQGVDCAYSAVPNPVEGTMLTVLREPCESLESAGDFSDFKDAFAYIFMNMNKSLQHTPELLPVLKQANVVDSGGMGILYIIEGMCAYLDGEIIEVGSERESNVNVLTNSSFGPDSVLEYGYCTEFVLQLMHAKTNIAAFSIKEFISYLQTIGDSIVAVLDEDIVKAHVHTFKPEKALAFARNYGEFISVKIENMSIQHSEVSSSVEKETEKVKYAIVTVAMGDGIKDYFAQIGADRIIDGGQTNNPSAHDFLDAFDSLFAEHIVVLPNNSNIYATAKQAAGMYDKCDIRVLETKSVAEGYSALSMMNTWAPDIDSFVSDMEMALSSVVSVSITKAVRDATIDGVCVKEGEYMAIADGKIRFVSEDKNSAVVGLLRSFEDIDEKSVITVFYGENVSDEEADGLIEAIEDEFSHFECGAVSGKQKIYDYYMAIE